MNKYHGLGNGNKNNYILSKKKNSSASSEMEMRVEVWGNKKMRKMQGEKSDSFQDINFVSLLSKVKR